MIYEIKVPLFVMLPRQRVKNVKVWLNMNEYRNLFFKTEHECKIKFYQLIKDRLPQHQFKSVSVSFEIYKCRTAIKKPTEKKPDAGGRIRKLDKSNVYAVLAKYFFDSLVQNGNLLDDNDTIIKTEVILPTQYINFGEEEYGIFTLTEMD